MGKQRFNLKRGSLGSTVNSVHTLDFPSVLLMNTFTFVFQSQVYVCTIFYVINVCSCTILEEVIRF